VGAWALRRASLAQDRREGANKSRRGDTGKRENCAVIANWLVRDAISFIAFTSFSAPSLSKGLIFLL
jgi:hypothetical protein